VTHVLASLGLVALDLGDVPRAEALFAESLTIGGVGSARWLIALNLEGMAGTAVLRGQPERAARLFGAAAALRKAAGAPVWPAVLPLHRRHMEAARQAMAEERFNDAWADGYAAPLTQIIALALEQSLVKHERQSDRSSQK
jgi:hypothetical protein